MAPGTGDCHKASAEDHDLAQQLARVAGKLLDAGGVQQTLQEMVDLAVEDRCRGSTKVVERTGSTAR